READAEDGLTRQEVDDVVARRPPRRGISGREEPRAAGRGDAREPEDAKRHDRRPDAHEDTRAVAGGERTETGREDRKQEPAGNACEPGRGRRVAEDALQEQRAVIK